MKKESFIGHCINLSIAKVGWNTQGPARIIIAGGGGAVECRGKVHLKVERTNECTKGAKEMSKKRIPPWNIISAIPGVRRWSYSTLVGPPYTGNCSSDS